MAASASNSPLATTTSHRVVVPFYLYAALSFLIGALLLLASAPDMTGHYFQPKVLATTHILALGWGTMIILGASHQLVPVLIEQKLYSENLAALSFLLAAIGIPLLVYSFYTFQMNQIAYAGGWMIIGAVLCFILNLVQTMVNRQQASIPSVFILTASFWLLLTVSLGLLLLYNFREAILPEHSLSYLPVHAHAGIAGWFLLLVLGVGSRLMPMFLISKYTNNRLLWWIYGLLNAGLVSYFILFINPTMPALVLLPLMLVLIAILLFVMFCFKCYQQRIRRKIDEAMKLSLISVLMLILPLILLLIAMLARTGEANYRIAMAYGFLIFFGWLTAIIMGMTFKTLPFIIWNKLYHEHKGTGKQANPKDLYSEGLVKWMNVLYLIGLLLFISGLFASMQLVIQMGAGALVLAAGLYNWNVFQTVLHKTLWVHR